jgi:hypothetical protein
MIYTSNEMHMMIRTLDLGVLVRIFMTGPQGRKIHLDEWQLIVVGEENNKESVLPQVWNHSVGLPFRRHNIVWLESHESGV